MRFIKINEGLLQGTGTNTSSVQKQKQKKMNIIKCLAHTKWGADQGNLLTIHKMIILSTKGVPPKTSSLIFMGAQLDYGTSNSY
jgi:hypothetical protein